MIVKKLRLQRAWSQEHLAELTGLTRRTIQRIEHDQKPSLDSQQALASVFEVSIETLAQGDNDMIPQENSHPNQVGISEQAARVTLRQISVT